MSDQPLGNHGVEYRCYRAKEILGCVLVFFRDLVARQETQVKHWISINAFSSLELPVGIAVAFESFIPLALEFLLLLKVYAIFNSSKIRRGKHTVDFVKELVMSAI